MKVINSNGPVVTLEITRRNGTVHNILLDLIDYVAFKNHTIGILACSGRFYARIRLGSKYQLLHRVILDAAIGMDVDHKNNNGLDNRRLNLVECTHIENCQNIHVTRNQTGIRGITWNARQGKWHARVTKNGIQHHLGFYTDLGDAENAIDAFNNSTRGCNH